MVAGLRWGPDGQGVLGMGPVLTMVTMVLSLTLLTIVSVGASASIYDYNGTIRYDTYTEHVSRMEALARKYPELVRLTTAQQEFGLPSVGTCGNQPCETHILTITNHTSFQSTKSRPEVLVSGEVHGDERVGPASVLAFAEFVCHERASNPWLDFLINNRVVTIIPMTNAVGYEMNIREEVQHRKDSKTGANRESGLTMENRIDPNRDFAFDQDPEKCMQTVAARTVNELFRARIFSILLTFHGGLNALGYEWGDTTHCERNKCMRAPDHSLMRALAERMSTYAGPAGRYEKIYPVGDMGSLVYPVRGGMEDYSYGASWSSAAVNCRPRTLGGYDKSNTDYPFESNRCVAYLIETSRQKHPKEYTLGSLESIKEMIGGGKGDGHVPRNVRLILAAVDSVEPYVSITDASRKSSDGTVIVSWRVGGAFQVDGTHLQYGTRRRSRRNHGFGKTYTGKSMLPLKDFEGDVFRQTVHVGPKPLFVRAAAIVDRALTGKANISRSSVKPVSHLANSRWDSTWSYSTNQSKISGASIWYSDVYRISLGGGTVKLEREFDYVWNKDIQGYSEEHILQALLGEKNLGQGKLFGAWWNGLRGPFGVRIPGPVVIFVSILCISIAAIIYLRRRKRRHADIGAGREMEEPEAEPLYEIGDHESETE